MSTLPLPSYSYHHKPKTTTYTHVYTFAFTHIPQSFQVLGFNHYFRFHFPAAVEALDDGDLDRPEEVHLLSFDEAHEEVAYYAGGEW